MVEKTRNSTRKSFGLEVLSAGNNSNLRKGGVIPVRGEITIGRKNDNLLILDDPYVFWTSCKNILKNNDYILEDLGSTNGTLLNGEKVKGREYLNPGDEIRIGSSTFKVIG